MMMLFQESHADVLDDDDVVAFTCSCCSNSHMLMSIMMFHVNGDDNVPRCMMLLLQEFLCHIDSPVSCTIVFDVVEYLPC